MHFERCTDHPMSFRRLYRLMAPCGSLAIVLAGQFFPSTLPLGCKAVLLARSWAHSLQCARTYFVRVQWEREVRLPQAYESKLFDAVKTLRPRPCPHLLRPCPGCPAWQNHNLPCHVRNMLVAVSVGINASAAWGADWVLRVRADLMIERFAVPVLDAGCVYVHLSPQATHHGPSDNLMLGPTTAMARLFEPIEGTSITLERLLKEPEALLAGRLKRLHEPISGLPLMLCQPPFEVWLAKPNTSGTADQRSGGLRHWFSNESSAYFARYAQSQVGVICGRGDCRWPGGISSFSLLEFRALSSLPRRMHPTSTDQADCGLKEN